MSSRKVFPASHIASTDGGCCDAADGRLSCLPVAPAIAGRATIPSANPAANESGPSDELLSAWTRDPLCVECGALVVSVADAALLVGPQRVAHRALCFVPALLRHYPYLRRLAAHEGAKEVRGAPFDANGEKEEWWSRQASQLPRVRHG